MTGRIGYCLEKAERFTCARPAHLIVCYDAAEVEEAKRFLGDRFGALVFVATGVCRGIDKAQRHTQWLHQAVGNSCSPM